MAPTKFPQGYKGQAEEFICAYAILLCMHKLILFSNAHVLYMDILNMLNIALC